MLLLPTAVKRTHILMRMTNTHGTCKVSSIPNDVFKLICIVIKWQEKKERENEMKLNDAFGFLFDSDFECIQ